MVTKIDICTGFKYLGVILAEIGSSTKHRHIMLSKLGRQCMYFFNEFRNLNFPIDLQLYLNDHVILPIALYGCVLKNYKMIPSDRLLT